MITQDVLHWTRNWLNSWRFLLIAPKSLYERQPALLPDVIDVLTRVYSNSSAEGAALMWASILRRARTDCMSQRTRMHLFVQALKFALNNTRMPLSSVVVESFYDVYAAVTSPGGPPVEAASLFGIFDWDKGKELRKALIDAFMFSDWPPGDLCLAAREPELFRKVFKRVIRRQKGDRYLQSMLSNLADRSDPEAGRLAASLRLLLRKPDFYEEWD